MVISCCAYGCTARAVTGGTRSFHRFPRNADMCKRWIKATRRKDFKATSCSYICSDHFVEEDFDESKTSGFCSRRYLKPDAVPSIFAFPDYLVRKKARTHEPLLNQTCPQSTADVELTKTTDHIDVNSRPTSSSVESIKAPTIRYIGDSVAKPTSGNYICSDHFVEASDDSKTSVSCCSGYLKTDSVPSVFLVVPDHLAAKKVNTCKPPLNEKCPQSTADAEVTKNTDHFDVNSSPKSSSLKSTTAPTIRYVGDCVAKSTSGSYTCLVVEEAFDESKTSGLCPTWYLKPDSVSSVFAFPDHLAPKKMNTRKPPLNEKCPQSTADVESTKTTDHIDVNSRPTSSSLKGIKGPTLRYVGDCIPKDTDSLTDTKNKLNFVLSAYQLQQKSMKGLMQKCRRMNKRYISVKNTLDELQFKSEPTFHQSEITH